jgi:hypothetical protein
MSKLVIKNKRQNTTIVVVFWNGSDRSISVGPRQCVELPGALPTELLKRKAGHREVAFWVVEEEPRVVVSRPHSRKSKGAEAVGAAEVGDPEPEVETGLDSDIPQ